MKYVEFDNEHENETNNTHNLSQDQNEVCMIDIGGGDPNNKGKNRC